MIHDLMGTQPMMRIHSTGVWENFAAPSTTETLLATREGAQRFISGVGLALHQTEVLGARPIGRSSATGAAIDIFEIGSKTLPRGANIQKLYDRVRLVDPSQLTGYHSLMGLSGNPGIRLLVPVKTKTMSTKLQAEISQLADDITALLQNDKTTWDIEQVPLDLLKSINDWRVNPNGTSHEQGLAGSHGSGDARTIRSDYWPKLESILAAGIKREATSGAAGRPDKPSWVTHRKGRAIKGLLD